jgi:hypothetical protein
MTVRQKIYLLSIFLFLFCFSSLLNAQKKNEIEKVRDFITKKRVNAAYLMLGFNQLALGSMNDFLESQDLPPVPKTYFSYGVGGHVIHNKIVVGVEIMRLNEKEGAENKTFTTAVGAKYINLNLGYIPSTQKGLMYYPYTGIGVGWFKMRTTENNINSFNAITTSQKGTEARRINFLLNFGFALDYFNKYEPKKKGQNSLVIGLRVGYLYSFSKKHWKVNYTYVPDGPGTGINGPYIRFVIGLGGYIETLIKTAI